MKVLHLFLALVLGASAFGLTTSDQAYLAKGGKNWIKNGGAEQARQGWATYADAAGTSPVDCTGGTATNTWTVSTTTPLAETASFIYTHAASNRQGDGVSYLFAIDKSEQGRQQQISFDYEVASGTFVPGVNPIGGATTVESDEEVYLYDVTNSQFIDLSNKRLLGSTPFKATFQTNPNSTSYRLCIHSATTATAAHTLRVDTIKVGPQVVTTGPPVTDWAAYTPLLVKFGTPSTVSFFYRRNGDTLQVRGSFVSGSPVASAARIELPLGLSIDSTKIYSTARNQVGRFSAITSSGTPANLASSNNYNPIIADPATSVIEVFLTNTGASAVFTQTNVSTFVASGWAVGVEFEVPIVGWSSGNTSAQAGDDTRIIAARYELTTGSTISNGGGVLPFSNKIFDTHTAISSGVWTVPASGVYKISSQVVTVAYACGAINRSLWIYLRKNSSNYCLLAKTVCQTTTSSAKSLSGSCLVSAVAGDTFDLASTNDDTTTTSSSTQNESYIEIQRISGALQLTAQDTVAARYTTASSQSQSTSDAILNYDTLDYDTTGSVTTGASWKFTAPIPGIYEVIGFYFSAGVSPSAGQGAFVSLYKNGVVHQQMGTFKAGASYTAYRWTGNYTGKIRLKAGDYIQVEGNNSNSAALGSDATQNWVAITRLGN